MAGERGKSAHHVRRSIPRSEAILDAAVEYTFPASDPISIDHAFGTARRRETDAQKPRDPAPPDEPE